MYFSLAELGMFYKIGPYFEHWINYLWFYQYYVLETQRSQNYFMLCLGEIFDIKKVVESENFFQNQNQKYLHIICNKVTISQQLNNSMSNVRNIPHKNWINRTWFINNLICDIKNILSKLCTLFCLFFDNLIQFFTAM